MGGGFRQESSSVQKVKNVGRLSIGGSGFMLLSLVVAVPNLGTVGEIGRFAQTVLPLVLLAGTWGLATGFGVLKAWPLARISILVFSSLLVLGGISGALVFLFMPNGDMSGWSLFAVKAFALGTTLMPAAVGVWWFVLFTRRDVKAYFQKRRTTGPEPAR
jgi:hypothetical protein